MAWGRDNGLMIDIIPFATLTDLHRETAAGRGNGLPARMAHGPLGSGMASAALAQSAARTVAHARCA